MKLIKLVDEESKRNKMNREYKIFRYSYIDEYGNESSKSIYYYIKETLCTRKGLSKWIKEEIKNVSC